MKRRTNKTQSRTQKLDRQQLTNVAGGGISLSVSTWSQTYTTSFRDDNDTRDK